MPIDQGSFWSLKNGAPSLLIGVPEIDDEHDELIRQLDHLRGDPDALLESERFSEVLSQLGAQINRHFINEERIFKSFGMPKDVEQCHIDAHTAILYQYTQLNMDLMQGLQLNRIEVLRMIKDWIVGHVAHHDLVIKDYLPE